MIKLSHVRWWVAALLFLAALLNYIDRNVLGQVADAVQRDLHLSNAQYASIVNGFLIAYTVANLLSGRVVDRLGVRASLALFVAWWTIANALTGLARSFTQLGTLRFLLGLGQAGCFTAAPKAVAEWFPLGERAVAVGLYSAGSTIGAALAPGMVALIAGADGHNWRWIFTVTPVFASLWLLVWLWLYRQPAAEPYFVERAYRAAKPPPAEPAPQESERARWGRVLCEPVVWWLVLARLLTDPLWFFFQFWFPKYLHQAHGLDQHGLALMGPIFLAATVGFLLGGLHSGRLIKRGLAPPAARLRAMLASAVLVPLVGGIPALPAVGSVIALAMLGAYGAAAWLGNLTALAVDLVPQRILGTAFGVITCGSALGGIFMNQSVAWLIDHRSYNDCFYAMALLHPLALLLLWHLRRRSGAPEALCPAT